MEHKIEITKIITTDDIVCILSCEAGGFDYWAQLTAPEDAYAEAKKSLEQDTPTGKIICYEEILARVLERGGAIDVFDFEDDEHCGLTLEKLLNGIRLNAENRPEDCNIEDGDACTMDCIIQYAVFGSLVYG